MALQQDPLSHPQPESHTDASNPTVSSESTSGPRKSVEPSDVDDRFPLFKKFNLENNITNELTNTFESDAFCDLQKFCEKLVPIVRVIVDQEGKTMGRPSFHYKVAFMTIRHFIDKHQVLQEGGHQNIFRVLLRSSWESSGEQITLAPYALAILFILAGPLLFTRPKALKLLGRAFNSIPKRRSDKLDKTKSLASRCLLWSFSRIVEWGVVASSLWSQALQMVAPLLSTDDMPPLVFLVMNSRSPAESNGSEYLGAKLAAMLVYDLITRRKDERFRSLGFKLLRQLIFYGTDGWPAVVNEPFTLGCFTQIDSLINNVECTPHERPQSRASSPRDLELVEIESAWDYLASAWYQVVREEVHRACQTLQPQDTIELTYETVEMWRMLLHTSGKDAAAVEPICDAHVKVALNPPKSENGTNTPLLHSIQTAKQLWLVTMNELKFPLRADVAEMILRKLMERREFYEGFTGKIRIAWFKLIEELVYCDPQRALSAISKVRVRSDDRTLIQQRIWCDIMHFIVVAEVRQRGVKNSFSISELIEFLRFPYTKDFDVKDEYVSLLWDTLLARTFSIAQERRKSAMVLELMEEIALSLGVEVKKDDLIERVRAEENFMDDIDRSRKPRRRYGERGRQF